MEAKQELVPQAVATLKYARISSRKVKIVADLIKGKDIHEALAILKYTPKASSEMLEKLLKSAIANAENNHNMAHEKLNVADIFANQGITKDIKTTNNNDTMNKTIEIAKTDFNGLCFVNLVDFDSIYGHRRDPIGYGKAIKEFDLQLEELMKYLRPDDLLMISSDHGNDPTFKGTDHTREQVPLIIYSKELIKPKQLPEMDSFAVIGATIADNFEVELPEIGNSILDKII